MADGDLHTVAYGTYTLTNLIDNFSYQLSPDGKFVFTQDFVVQGTSQANFNTNVATAEAELNKADKRLLVTWEGSTWRDHNPADSSNSGMLTRGTLDIIGDEELDLMRSRHYRFKCEGFLPASEFRDGSTTGWFDGTVRLQLGFEDRPVYTFTGEYRGESAATAFANYDDATNGGIARTTVWLQTALNAIVVGDDPLTNYENIGETYTFDDHLAVSQDSKRLTYTLTYRFRLLDETAGSNIGNSKFTTELFDIRPERIDRLGFSVSPRDQGTIPVRYSASATFKILRNQWAADDDTRSEAALKTIYETEIKPVITFHIQQVLGLGGNTVAAGVLKFDSENISYGFANSTISVQWSITAVGVGTSVNGLGGMIAYEETVEEAVNFRKTHVQRADGVEFSMDTMSPGPVKTAVQTATYEMLNTGSAPSRSEVKSAVPILRGEGGTWDLDTDEVSVAYFEGSGVNGETLIITNATVSRAYTFKVGESRPGAEITEGNGTPLFG